MFGKRTLTVGVLLLAGTIAAHATDILPPAPPPPPPPPPAFSWTGPYIGVFAGHGWGQVDWEYVISGNNPTPNPFATSGHLLGVALGYNFQTGAFVLGAEADIAWTGIGGAADCPNPIFSCELSMNWLATVRARAGVAFGQFLVYGTGGLAIANQTVQTVHTGGVNVPPSGTPVNGTTLWDLGWTAGGGVALALSHGLALTAEVLYFDLGADAVYVVDNNLEVTARHTGLLAKVGITWAFGGP